MINVDFEVVNKKLFTTKKSFIMLEGGRGGAKSEDVARYLIMEALKKSNQVILCAREFQNSIKESVHSLLRRIIVEYNLQPLIRVCNNKIECVNGSKFIFSGLARNIGSIKSIDNITHCWIEEGQYITKESIDILNPTLRVDGVKFIVTMNRLLDTDPIYELLVNQYKDLTEHIYTTYLTNRFCSKLFILKAEICKKNNPDEYEHKYLGKPLLQGYECILDRTQVRAAMRRKPGEVCQKGPVMWGIDVARMGDDKTLITRKKGLAAFYQNSLSKKRSYEIYNFLIPKIKDKLTEKIKIDATGLGGGVCDDFHKEGYNLQEIIFNAVAKNQNKYDSKASEMWFEFQDLIRKEKISIPEDEELYEELISRKFEFDNKSRRCVVSKKHTKKLLKRSPDKADSLLLAFYDLEYNCNVEDGREENIVDSNNEDNNDEEEFYKDEVNNIDW